MRLKIIAGNWHCQVFRNFSAAFWSGGGTSVFKLNPGRIKKIKNGFKLNSDFNFLNPFGLKLNPDFI